MGALIIEDRPDIHGIPDQIADMPELVITIQVTRRILTLLVPPIGPLDICSPDNAVGFARWPSNSASLAKIVFTPRLEYDIVFF